MYSFTLEITEQYCNNAYQHVHHADAVRLLEEGRLAALKQCGYPYEYFIEKGLFLVVTNLSVNYLRELKLGPIQVNCSLSSNSQKALTLKQSIKNAKGKTCIEASVTIMCLDGKLKRAVSLPKELLGIFVPADAQGADLTKASS